MAPIRVLSDSLMSETPAKPSRALPAPVAIDATAANNTVAQRPASKAGQKYLAASPAENRTLKAA